MLFSSVKKAFKILKLLKSPPIAQLENVFPLLHFVQTQNQNELLNNSQCLNY